MEILYKILLLIVKPKLSDKVMVFRDGTEIQIIKYSKYFIENRNRN